jgi:hypothetical protein
MQMFNTANIDCYWDFTTYCLSELPYYKHGPATGDTVVANDLKTMVSSSCWFVADQMFVVKPLINSWNRDKLWAILFIGYRITPQNLVEGFNDKSIMK